MASRRYFMVETCPLACKMVQHIANQLAMYDYYNYDTMIIAIYPHQCMVRVAICMLVNERFMQLFKLFDTIRKTKSYISCIYTIFISTYIGLHSCQQATSNPFVDYMQQQNKSTCGSYFMILMQLCLHIQQCDHRSAQRK